MSQCRSVSCMCICALMEDAAIVNGMRTISFYCCSGYIAMNETDHDRMLPTVRCKYTIHLLQ